jgi:hypothetical protein
MGNGLKSDFSGPVTVFQDRRLPELATPVGYAALIDAFRLQRTWFIWILLAGVTFLLMGGDCPASPWRVDPQTGFPSLPAISGAAHPVATCPPINLFMQ